jgi:hypothetical protein
MRRPVRKARIMTTTVSRPDRTVPLLASVAVASLVALGAAAGVVLQQHAGDTSPTAPSPPFASYPGSDVFDNQPAAPWWTDRGDRVSVGRVTGPIRAPGLQLGQ